MLTIKDVHTLEASISVSEALMDKKKVTSLSVAEESVLRHNRLCIDENMKEIKVFLNRQLGGPVFESLRTLFKNDPSGRVFVTDGSSVSIDFYNDDDEDQEYPTTLVSFFKGSTDEKCVKLLTAILESNKIGDILSVL